MNIHTYAYTHARNQLHNSRFIVGALHNHPVCSLTEEQWKLLVDAEQRLEFLPTIIDRLRFMAKHDRSKYTPHVGAKQRSKHDTRPVCCLPDATPNTEETEND